MNLQILLEKYSPFIRKNYLPIGLGLLGLIFLVYGLIVLVSSSDSSKDIVLESADVPGLSESDSNAAEDSTRNLIYVDVEGAVAKPGVYSLPQNARVRDGLISAGGLSEQADRVWVSRSLNLASKLADGAKIYIPRINENITGIKGATSTTGGTAGNSGLTIGNILGAKSLININSASESELDILPGIGPVTAQKIISNRPYQTPEELVSKKVVSQKVFDGIKERITL